MDIRADEISKIISMEIEGASERLELEKKGTVISVGDGIASVYGLWGVMASEMVLFENGVYGLAFNLDETMVGVVILGEDVGIQEGDEVKATGRILQVPVGEELAGRVIDPVGKPLDGKGEIRTDNYRPVEGEVPNVVQRQPVKEPLQTGIKAIDAMIPIGRGQRELILGDKGIGKTAICIDTIINQRGGDVRCIYVAIGQKNSTVARVIKTLEEHGAMDYTTVVHAGSSDPATLQYIAPYAGCAIGEEIRDKGGHALIIYDDLIRHAWAYRQLSLLLRRPPGREAFPGDIFYLHSRLLERAAKLSDELGGGSLTAIPIVETQAGDLTAYIPTNVISITDGQIYLEADLFYAGIRPAINVGLSVSRVGGNAQVEVMKKVAGGLRLDLAQYRELEKFISFGTELDKATQEQIERGRRLVELLKQDQYEPMAVEEQVMVINAGVEGFLDRVDVDRISEFESKFIDYMKKNYSEFGDKIRRFGKLEPVELEKLNDITRKYVYKNFISKEKKEKIEKKEE
ncbi:MAG: F0F1 ATP synthase subunit alpha [Candidatus Coatesbacteria bacterium 4484_99]|uniref:ATP synthase subunit alpha n=1 Tax=Candidatus Coatesbacteria bacterium 4484_99 TaxID=1970774 RepID=A0A1W9S0F3_9BACT|nr:MAG: F0F1 ATP synthase subunit alpha [Candidatus Coatesbacteria bacterium 4484_99]RLC40705.1 MAG: F0F1 ATP synthase subunit alpha [Candidatus Coatesbacteria bacterium]RLC43839.1 MAG: F0F1 ATP synthase subunit alpha [Candidatus Coatesbacteria bacterium]